jgi:hypothetical protein
LRPARLESTVTLLALAAGFLAFMALIGAVHALDRWSLGRFGYAPFALVNALAMLVPSGALLIGLAALRGADPAGVTGFVAPALLVGLGLSGGLAMAWLIARRTNPWVALIAAPLMLVAAPVLVFSVLFRGMAED